MLGLQSPNSRYAEKYGPIDPTLLTKTLANLSSDWSNATFVDLGCGKGRALIIAAEAGFAEVIGVELSAKLAKSAIANIQRMKLGNVQVVEGDALEFKFDRPDTLLFMYNPFGPAILSQVIAKIGTAPRRPQYIVYANPLYGDLFDELQGYELALSEPSIKTWRRT